jgi:hypothetical protein
MTDSATGPATEIGRDPHLDWYPKLLIPASRTLRGVLGIDEEAFRRHSFHGAPRDFVFWTALDEVEKTAMILMRLHEFLGGEPIKVATPADSTDRTAIGIVLEEERLRARRLCELLTELVLFGQKDEDIYYNHFLLLNELCSASGFNSDLRDFHGAESAWVRATIVRATNEIRVLEQSIDSGFAWYAKYKPPIDPSKWKDLRTSARQRLKRALPLMTDFERLALGTTYEEAFGRPSSSIHYTAGVDAATSTEQARSEIDEATKIGVLGLCVVRRCWGLLGRPPGAAVEQVARVLDSNTEASRYIELLNQGRRVAVGDFVLARGFLGEVIDEMTSQFGYRSFRVDLLAERPLPQIGSDWFRARDVVLLFARKKLMTGVARVLGSKVAFPETADLRDSILAAWDVGLREHINREGPGADQVTSQALDAAVFFIQLARDGRVQVDEWRPVLEGDVADQRQDLHRALEGLRRPVRLFALIVFDQLGQLEGAQAADRGVTDVLDPGQVEQRVVDQLSPLDPAHDDVRGSTDSVDHEVIDSTFFRRK